MNQNPKRILKNLKDHVVLTSVEKDAGRANLRAFMDMRPAVARPVLSPFSWITAPAMRYAFGFLLAFGVVGSGTAFAENARPGDVLYAVKLKINEPVQLAVTFDPEDKTALRVALTEERLKELAELAVASQEDVGATALAAASLSEQVSSAQNEISELHTDGESSAAYRLARELSGVISSNAAILASVEGDPEMNRVLATELNENDILEETIATALAEDELVVSIKDAQEEAVASLEELRVELTQVQENLDASDLTEIEKRISTAEVSVSSARALDASGSDKDALKLYADAEEITDAIVDLIEAERSLNIDLIRE